MHFRELHTALALVYKQCIEYRRHFEYVDKVLQISEVASKVLDGLFLNVCLQRFISV